MGEGRICLVAVPQVKFLLTANQHISTLPNYAIEDAVGFVFCFILMIDDLI